MTMQRGAAFALAVTAAFWGAAHAQDKYPSRPVTLIVPQAAGGANDAIARVVAQKLTEQTEQNGQSFIVENRPGAGGNIGTALAAKAKPDGYTLPLTVNSAHGTPEQFAALVREDLPKWARIVKDSGATID